MNGLPGSSRSVERSSVTLHHQQLAVVTTNLQARQQPIQITGYNGLDKSIDRSRGAALKLPDFAKYLATD